MAAVSRENLGAWLITVNPRLTDVVSMIAAGDLGGDGCVAPNYRTALMEPGDPIVVWVSAGAGVGPGRGLWGVGEVTGRPGAGADPPIGGCTCPRGSPRWPARSPRTSAARRRTWPASRCCGRRSSPTRRS